jgi:hypothetical protein
MSFSNWLNEQLDGPIDGTAANEFASNSLYLAQLVNGGWENAVLADTTVGSDPHTKVAESLTDFLDQYNPTNSDAVLRSLVGSWGVDTTPTNGVYEGWAILDHTGTMAMSPEPATWILLISAGAGLLVYRRWRRLCRRVCP